MGIRRRRNSKGDCDSMNSALQHPEGLGVTSFLNAALDWFERHTERFAELLERRTTWFLAGVSLLYLAVTGVLACWKPMWVDELFTFYLARLPSASAVWDAVSGSIAPMPPSFYLLTRLSHRLLGPPHLASRLPEMLGFLLASLCLFRFLHRRTSALYGLVGMLVPWITGAYHYAYEARPYGLVLGFCGLSLVCWQAATEGPPRKLALAGLFAGLAGAVFSHYGAILLLFPLGLGELARSVSGRRMDWPVWLSLAGAGIPFAVFFPLVGRSISAYGSAMWSRPRLGSLPDCYVDLLSGAALPMAAILSAAALYRWLRAPGPTGCESRHSVAIPGHELAATVGLLLLPLAGLLQALLVTGQITARYVIALVLGFAILFAMAAYQSVQGSVTIGSMILVVLLAAWGANCRRDYRALRADAGRIARFHALAARDQSGLPILIGGLTFFPLAYYAPAAVSRRLYYLVDPEAARRYTGSDSLDLNIARYREIAPINVVEAGMFLETHRQFLLYSRPDPRAWVLPKLKDAGARIELVDATTDGCLYRVTTRSN